jgi:hypothetical protein
MMFFPRFLICIRVNAGPVSAGCQQLVCGLVSTVYTKAAQDVFSSKPVQRSQKRESTEERRGLKTMGWFSINNINI